MSQLEISPLARRLAEENNVDWRDLHGSGAGGKVVERDVLEYLARVMAGEEDVDPTPEPVPDGMAAWPEEDVRSFQQEVQASRKDAGLDEIQQELSAADRFGAGPGTQEDGDGGSRSDALATGTDEISEDIFLFADDAAAGEPGAAPPRAGRSPSAVPPAAEDESEDELLVAGEESAGDADTADEGPAGVGQAGHGPSPGEPPEAQRAPRPEPGVPGRGTYRPAGEEAGEEAGELPDVFASDEEDAGHDRSGAALFDEEPAGARDDGGAADALEIPPLGEMNGGETAGAEPGAGEAGPRWGRAGEDGWRAEHGGAWHAAGDAGASRQAPDVHEARADDQRAHDERRYDERRHIERRRDDRGEDERGDDERAHGRGAAPFEGEAADAAAREAPANGAAHGPLERPPKRPSEGAGHLPPRPARQGADEHAPPPEEPQAAESAANRAPAEDTAPEHIAREHMAPEHMAPEHMAPEHARAEPEPVGWESEPGQWEPAEAAPTEGAAERPAEEAARRPGAVEAAEQTAAASVPSTSQAAPGLPLVSYGTLLRRHVDVTALAGAQLAVGLELGESEPLSPAPFLLRAAAKAVSEGDWGDGSVALLKLDGGRVERRRVDGSARCPFLELVRALASGDRAGSGASAALSVVDMSALDVDEAVLDVGGPLLTLGRILYDNQRGGYRSTLSLSGEVPPERGARLLARVAELLDAPVRLMV